MHLCRYHRVEGESACCHLCPCLCALAPPRPRAWLQQRGDLINSGVEQASRPASTMQSSMRTVSAYSPRRRCSAATHSHRLLACFSAESRHEFESPGLAVLCNLSSTVRAWTRHADSCASLTALSGLPAIASRTLNLVTAARCNLPRALHLLIQRL